METIINGFVSYSPYNGGKVSDKFSDGVTFCKNFSLKVISCLGKRVDTGTFYIYGVPVRLVVSKQDERSNIDIGVRATTSYKKNNILQWYYPCLKPLNTVGQCFLQINGEYFDVTTLPEMEEMQKQYSNHIEETKKIWEQRYNNVVLNCGLSCEEARKIMKLKRWEVDEFVYFLKELRKRKVILLDCQNALKYENKSHIENVLDIKCTNYKGARKAIEYYLNEISI